MNKTLLAASLLLATTHAFAAPYVGVGYQAGATQVERSSLRSPVVSGRALDLSGTDWNGSLTLLAGYRLTDHFSLEMTWRRVESEDSFELRQAGPDDEWDASVDGSHFTLAPVFRLALGERLGLRTTAGLVVGDYDIENSHILDVDDGPDQLISRVRSSSTKVGGLIGVGLEYTTPWKFDVVAEAQHQRTRIASSSSLALGMVYRF